MSSKIWIQPLYNYDAVNTPRIQVATARILSLALGIVSSLLGPRLWMAVSPCFAKLTRSKPTQAAFVAQPLDQADSSIRGAS